MEPLQMKIHNEWFDMAGFDHPGGPIMLKLGEGRDATALFEAHHPMTSRTRLNGILDKYRTKEECVLRDKRDEDEFLWPEPETKEGEKGELAPVSAFAQELRLKVTTYFKAEAARRGVPLLEATKATPMRWLQIGVLASFFIATLPYFFLGQYWTLLATPLTYWVLGVNVFHDGSHFALSRDWRVNMVGTYLGWWFSSPFEWYHQHVIGHHAYPNIPNRDPDLYHNATMERHTSTLRWRSAHKHQDKTWYGIWIIGTYAMNFLKPFQMYASGYYNKSVRMVNHTTARHVQHWLGRALVFFICHVWMFFVFPPFKAFLFSAVPVAVVSVSFMACSQVNHLTESNVDVRSHDYYKHQILTSHTFATDSFLVFLFTGGLNFQIEHHLFPTINHCHLHKIQPMVKQLCEKHNIRYHESATFTEALGKYVAHLRELSVPTEANVVDMD